MKKATYVAGVGQRIPSPQGVADGPNERIRRLSFDVQEPHALIPTVVTREGGPDSGGVRVPRQAFTVAPLLDIVKACAGSSRSGARASPDGPGVPPPPPRIDAAGVSLPGHAPGYKESNQDSALLLDAFLSNRQQLLAVMDGHGPEGHRVSGFVRSNLPFTMLAALIEGEHGRGGGGGGGGSEAGEPACTGASGAGAKGPLQRALCRAVASLDSQLAFSGIDVQDSGSTAALVHLHGRRLTAAWVGDSRILLGLPDRGARRGTGREAQSSTGGGGGSGGSAGDGGASGGERRATAGEGQQGRRADDGGGEEAGRGGGGGSGWRVAWASTDHKPESPEELARISGAGGRVARSVGPRGPAGPYRVWFKDQPYPGLAMSRALGDLPGRRIGLTALPSLASLSLPERGPALLVLASDGVWELLGNEQVLQLAAGAGSAAEAASQVAQQSRRAWVKEYGGSYIDDITAIVVRFDMPPG